MLELSKLRTILDNAQNHWDDSVGFHGTSVFALHELITNESLPRGLMDGSLYFEPKPSVLPFRISQCLIPQSDEEALRNAYVYAQVIATDHAKARALGLDPIAREDPGLRGLDEAYDSFLVNLLEYDFHEPVFDGLRELGYTPEKLKEAWTRVEDPRGVLIGLKEDIYTLDVCEAEPGDQGLRITNLPSTGLPVHYIAGVRVLDRVEGTFPEDWLCST